MFRTSCVRLYGPILKLLLFWTGTLISEATGFCVAFCNAAASSASLGVAGLSAGAAVLSVGADGAGLSCANAGRLNRRIRGIGNSKTRFIVSNPLKLVTENQCEKIIGLTRRTDCLPPLPYLRSLNAVLQVGMIRGDPQILICDGDSATCLTMLGAERDP